jgi:hypothetical protein
MKCGRLFSSFFIVCEFFCGGFLDGGFFLCGSFLFSSGFFLCRSFLFSSNFFRRGVVSRSLIYRSFIGGGLGGRGSHCCRRSAGAFLFTGFLGGGLVSVGALHEAVLVHDSGHGV